MTKFDLEKRLDGESESGGGIEGKGCKILSRLSLSEGSQLEVSSAHSAASNHRSSEALLQTFSLQCAVGSVSSVQSDRLSNIVRPGLAKPQWYHCQQSLNPPSSSSSANPSNCAVQCNCNACDFDSSPENRLTLHTRIFHISPIRVWKGFAFC